MAHRHGTRTRTWTRTQTQTQTQTWYQPRNHKKKTSGGIYAILNCFLMYKIKIGPETDTAAAPGHRHGSGIGISLRNELQNYLLICRTTV